MKYRFTLALWFAASLLSIAQERFTTLSPDGKISLEFSLDHTQPFYRVSYGTTPVLQRSPLGLELLDRPSLGNGFRLLGIDTTTHRETWKPVWGEVSEILCHYRELQVHLAQESTGLLLDIRFRVFNDGIGFRYEFPEQPTLQYLVVTRELTGYSIIGDPKAFWIPGDYDTNEYPYTTSRLSQVDALTVSAKHTEIGTRVPIDKNVVQTPLMLVAENGFYINIHEAALVDYPAMYLRVQPNQALTTELAPDARGNKAYLQTPCHTPWRTVLVTKNAADLLMSKTILNLNEPSVIANTDWIKPAKFLGIWWGMHVGVNTWNYANVGNLRLRNTNWQALKPNGKHGATTAETKRYLDFAAQHGFDAVLVEGWNVGWEDWAGNWKEEVFDFVTPYPDFDVYELQQYAKAKGVQLIMHHETSSSVTNYERRLDESIRFMVTNGYHAVKTGYVGRIIPRGEYHDGQWMVNHYVRVAEKLARNKIMVDAHESVRPTGLHRTYPNWMANEAARGNEFNAWSSGNPPEHETILPFTRFMGGPMDYTPGIFQIKLDYYQTGNSHQVHTTLAKQLALYVTLYSPLQMAADLPENYQRFPDAFQFIKDVPVDWQNTRVLSAEPGEYIITARQDKSSEAWFLGAITDENSRTLLARLDFLDPTKEYIMTVYGDAPDAHWETNPMAYRIATYTVNARTTLQLRLAAGGGAAATFRVATPEQRKGIKKYKTTK